jgi:hypothetical protein
MEVKRTPSPEQVQATKRAERIRSETVRQTVAAEQKPAPKEPEEKKPVLNGQGQTIGTRLNVTA